jgi:hypothetical protein
MPSRLPTLLILTSVLLFTAPGCSLRYDADELPGKSDATDGVDDDADASGVDPADASGVQPADASPDQPDAAPEPDAAVNPGICGDEDEMCCENSPVCGWGDPFIECDEKTQTCLECGADGDPCCETGDECQDTLLLGCLGGICSSLL